MVRPSNGMTLARLAAMPDQIDWRLLSGMRDELVNVRLWGALLTRSLAIESNTQFLSRLIASQNIRSGLHA